jgi:deoxyribodipyrimidine photolyase-like uncharacterized protein
MRDREKMVCINQAVERDVHAEGKIMDEKRKVLNSNRPDKGIWNFKQEEGETIPHVLRVNADPRLAYEDGRIEEILEVIEKLAEHLKTEQEPSWERLVQSVVEIFVAQETDEKKEFDDWIKEGGDLKK